MIKTSFGAFIKLDSDFCFKSGALELIIVIEQVVNDNTNEVFGE